MVTGFAPLVPWLHARSACGRHLKDLKAFFQEKIRACAREIHSANPARPAKPGTPDENRHTRRNPANLAKAWHTRRNPARRNPAHPASSIAHPDFPLRATELPHDSTTRRGLVCPSQKVVPVVENNHRILIG